MAIQPPYAQAILSGDKRVEFRKRPLAADVHTVLIYETVPTQRIVGMFTVVDTVRLSPTGLWRRFGAVGSIGHSAFMEYYAKHPMGVGLVVGSPVRFSTWVALSALDPRPAVPQSFSYLPPAVLGQVVAAQAECDAVNAAPALQPV